MHHSPSHFSEKVLQYVVFLSQFSIRCFQCVVFPVTVFQKICCNIIQILHCWALLCLMSCSPACSWTLFCFVQLSFMLLLFQYFSVSKLYKCLSILYGCILLQHFSDLALVLQFLYRYLYLYLFVIFYLCFCICIIQMLHGCVLQTTVARLFRFGAGAVFGEMVRKKLDKLFLTPSRSCHNV